MNGRTRNTVAISLVALIIVALSAGCLAHPMESVPTSLIGTWRGESEVRLPLVFTPPADDDPTDDVVMPVAVEITIHEDSSVSGTLGGAELVDCVLKQNRGELGRQLNIATDYIIMDGYLSGSIVPGDIVPGDIVPEDEAQERDVSIPFNIAEGHMLGTIFWLKELRYPRPLLPRMDLAKAE